MPDRCPLCDQRKGKRYCPAKLTLICTICCGAKREVEIDCPSQCIYLQAGREHEKGKNSTPNQMTARDPRFLDQEFVDGLSPVIMAVNQRIIKVRWDYPEMTDADLREALKALIQTYETELKGIYYDFPPAGGISRQIFLAIKQLAENSAEKNQSSQEILRTDALLDSLKFIAEILEASASPRPRSRIFLDDLQKCFADSPVQQKDSLIVLP